MPGGGLLADSMNVDLGGGGDPWPDDAKLIQHFDADQALLNDRANSLATQAFLRMCDLNYQLEMKPNAEQMSPSGRLPLLKCGRFVISEFEPIVAFIANKGISLSAVLDQNHQADMRAYMSLVGTVLVNAELYVLWKDSAIYDEITSPRYGSVYPWPLNYILVNKKKWQVERQLAATGWKEKTLEKVYEDVEESCQVLSDRLRTNEYFFNKPTELDALVFGHLFSILMTPLPNVRLASIVRNYRNLVDLCQRIEKQFFHLK